MGNLVNSYRFGSVTDCHTVYDGTNEYTYVVGSAGTSLDFERTDTFSVSTWLNLDTLKNWSTFYSSVINISGYPRGVSYRVQLDGRLQLILQNRGSTTGRIIAYSTSSLSITTDYNITISYDGSSDISGLKLYINGSSDTLTTGQNNLTLTIAGGTTAFGTMYSFTSNYFDGKIYKVIVYNDVVTAGESTTINSFGRGRGLIGIGNEVSQWELGTLNPVDVIGSNNGTSVNQDASNIICE